MVAARSKVIVGAVVACLVSGVLTVWVASRSAPQGVDLKAGAEDLHAGGAPPPVLAGRQRPPRTDIRAEHYEAPFGDVMGESPAAPVVRAARASAAPPPRLAPANAPIPPAETSQDHDVLPLHEKMAAALEVRARGYLRRLDGIEDGAGSPMGRVANLFAFLDHQHCAGGTCQSAQRATEDYLRGRTELIRQMLEAFLESDGAYDGAREHQALTALHTAFKADMATIAAGVPMLAMLPEILETTLHVPDYLEAPQDDTRSPQ